MESALLFALSSHCSTFYSQLYIRAPKPSSEMLENHYFIRHIPEFQSYGPTPENIPIRWL
jgi:hypothetical protein